MLASFACSTSTVCCVASRLQYTLVAFRYRPMPSLTKILEYPRDFPSSYHMASKAEKGIVFYTTMWPSADSRATVLTPSISSQVDVHRNGLDAVELHCVG